MARQHITCQWNGQAARLVRNKCRDRADQRPYVKLRPLAYVTRAMPRGNIGAPPERGAEAYAIWSGHVSAPDPRLALIKVRVLFVHESQDPVVSGPDPAQGFGTRLSGHTRGGSGPYPEVRSTHSSLNTWRQSELYRFVLLLRYFVSVNSPNS